MTGLLTVRDAIRDFIRKFDEIINPIFRFIFAMIVFNTINKQYGYFDLFNNKTIVFLLSVISALVPTTVMIFVAGFVIVANCFSVSLEVGICCAVLFIMMYCLYMRMFIKCGWILAIVPLLFLWDMEYAVPIIVAVFAGASGVVPAAFGVLIHYFTALVREVHGIVSAPVKDEDFMAYKYIVDHLMKNKEMMVPMIAFAVVILITTLIYLMPFDYSWYVAIGVGGILNIIVFGIVGGKLGVTIETGVVVMGSLIGMLISAAIRLIKSLLDYSHKEVVQFEDDDYYYYVKAIPKYTSKREKKKALKKAEKDEEIRQNAKLREEAMKAQSEEEKKNAQPAGEKQPEDGRQANPRFKENPAEQQANAQRRNMQQPNAQQQTGAPQRRNPQQANAQQPQRRNPQQANAQQPQRRNPQQNNSNGRNKR